MTNSDFHGGASSQSVRIDQLGLKSPWFVVGWPGIGGVASHVIQQLDHLFESDHAEVVVADSSFEIEHILIRDGISFPGPLPRLPFRTVRSGGDHDLVLFLPERQPVNGGLELCRRVMAAAISFGVERVVTFAAMTSTIDPQATPSTTFCTPCALTSTDLLNRGMTPMDHGSVKGLNGLMLLAAQEAGIPSQCLIGEISNWGLQLPSPKTSKILLENFGTLIGRSFDLKYMDKQIEVIEEYLIEQKQATLAQFAAEHGQFASADEVQQDDYLATSELDNLEGLFSAAISDKTKTAVLKAELDRLGVFSRFEDRFLDLFRECS
ncbi:MAG: PAC2 family protein [Planctomycetota bacterium]|nr:PAC2 family protein [Planctomycetota bacterium]